MQPIKKMRNQNKKIIPIFFSLSIWEAPENENRELKRDNFLFCLFLFSSFLLVGCESPSSHQQPTNSAIEPKRKATVILAFKIFLDKKMR